MREAGLHGAHGRLHGHFARRLVLPVLLVTEEEEAAELLAPRGQQSWRGRERESGGREEKKAIQSCWIPGSKKKKIVAVLAAIAEKPAERKVWGRKGVETGAKLD